MARQPKCRKVCQMPQIHRFTAKNQTSNNLIQLTIDEFEVIRLMDYMGLTQEECAEKMQVARTTVQRMYADARRKTAIFFVEGRPLEISGGHFELCQSSHCSYCCKKKGENTMKIAVTYDQGDVFQHFGKSEFFKLYTTTDNKIESSEVVPTNGNGHGALSQFLKGLGVEVVICGGIGEGAQTALKNEGIQLYAGTSGNTDEQVQALLDGRLTQNPVGKCNHHHDHEHGHSCGGHQH